MSQLTVKWVSVLLGRTSRLGLPVDHHDTLQTAKQTSFILGTVKPAHLTNYIIPAMASTRGKLLFNCFRAHVHASTRCLLSKEAPFQQPLCNDGPGWPSGWATPTRSRSGCLHYSVYPMIRPTRLWASILHLLYLLPLSRKGQLEIQ